jgi:hypothetical protein
MKPVPVLVFLRSTSYGLTPGETLFQGVTGVHSFNTGGQYTRI